MEYDDFQLDSDKPYRISIDWNDKLEDSKFSCALMIDGQWIALERFAKYLNTLEGSVMELTIRE